MRNYTLRISALIPSKWFHKLKNIIKPREKNPFSSSSADSKPLPHFSSSYFSNRSHTSKESYFSNRSHTSKESKILQISPRNSLHKIQNKRKTVYKPSPPSSSSSSSVSAGCNKNKIKFLGDDHDSSSAFFNLKLSSSADDIIIDINNRDFKKEIKVFDSTEKACRASKLTKETLKTHHLSVKVINKEKKCEEEEDPCRFRKKHQETVVSSGRRRRSSANSPRIKLRVSSPRRIKVSPRRRKSRSQNRQVLDSFAVIKNSVDPKKDFRESMVEMIVENNIRDSKDLEDLLTCYLSLNHKEYHDLIIKVFVQVWLQVVNSTFASK